LEDIMRKIISLVLLLAVFGMSVASAAPARWYARKLPNLQSASVDQPGLLGPWARVMLRFLAPSAWQVFGRYSAPRQDVPVPPVCGISCLLRPVQGIAQ
jgi:hypothetical protein